MLVPGAKRRVLSAGRAVNAIRKAAVAGTLYPGSPSALRSAIDRHLAAVDRDVDGDLLALIAPHAGLTYSGSVAAHAYHLLRGRTFDVAVLVGPSHFVGFEGVSIVRAGGFETPLGAAPIDTAVANALIAATPVVHEYPAAHSREHSIEMQLPFLTHVAPKVPIVPMVMGYQTDHTARALAGALERALAGRRALLIASTDLSHYHEAISAAALDAVVTDCVARFDADALQDALSRTPEHACGGGPTVAVMRAAWMLGARDAVVLHYADSGDVSGDKSAVVGYMAAALGRFKSVTTEDTMDTEVQS